MKIHRVLFPTDFSHHAEAALALAASLARDHDAELVIVHVEQPAIAFAGGDVGYVPVDPAAKAIERLEKVRPADDRVRCSHRVLMGDPAARIVEAAEELDVDMIVMSTHGRSGVLRALLGSVAESIVRKAPCPVLTYRPRKRQTADELAGKASEVG